MPAESKWPAFNCAAWIQSQLAMLVSAEMVTVAEARAAIEAIADDDRFWGLLEPMTLVALDALERDPAMARLMTEHADAERRKRGGVS